MAVNYNILQPIDYAGNAQRGFETGQNNMLQSRRQSALNALGQNPGDTGAINALMAVDPRTGMAFEARQRTMAAEQQQQERARAFSGALSQAPGVPQQARDYGAATGDIEGTQQLISLYAKADEAKRAQIKEKIDFIAATSPMLKQVADPNQRLMQARALAQQAGLDPNQVTPESVADFALDGAAAQALGLKGQFERLDREFTQNLEVARFGEQQRVNADASARGWAGVQTARYNATKPDASSGKPPSGYRWTPEGNLAPIPGGPGDVSGKLKPIPPTGFKAIQDNRNALGKIDKALRAIEANPNATGLKAFAPEFALQRADPAGVPARAAIADIGSLVINQRSGAAVSAAEFPRLAPFIPSARDDAATVKAKLSNMRAELAFMVQEDEDFYSPENGYRPAPARQPTPTPSPAPKKAPTASSTITVDTKGRIVR